MASQVGLTDFPVPLLPKPVLQEYKIYTGSGNQGYEKYTPSSMRGMKTELVQILVA
jgi:hypothetical protein